MINFSSDFLRDLPEVSETQEAQILVNRFVLPAFATDEHRTQMFRHLWEALDDVTFTESRILVESGDDFINIRRLPGGGYDPELHPEEDAQ